MADGFVSVSRRIEAPAEQLFALVADSANHPLFDGSGMVLLPVPGVRVSGVGDAFVMNMHHPRFGFYQMRSEIVEYEAGRRLVWEPARVLTDEQGGGTESAHYRWGYDFVPDGDGATTVTESFDCTRSGPELREATEEGEGWRDAMTASLDKLELLAKATGAS